MPAEPFVYNKITQSCILNNRIHNIYWIPVDSKTSVPMIECKEFNKPENNNDKMLHNKSVKSA